MIGRIRGILIKKAPPTLLVEVNGVGYELQVPLNSFYLLPQIDKEIVLHTHFVVRDDAQMLYGFVNEEQRSLFRMLIKVNGIGPKLALAILSGMEPEIFIHCIIHGDTTALTNLPGVGKKTAERLVIEMRDSVMTLYSESSAEQNLSVAVRESISALIALGYKQNEAQRLVSPHKGKNLSSEELIRLALKEKK